ncbi:MAG: NAD(P)/FAD-dependent oxidoreductase, partial [Candidatus Hodgkinia cicadicola]
MTQTPKPEVTKTTKPSETSLTEVKTLTSPTSTEVESKTSPQPVEKGTGTPQPVVRSERLAIIGSGLSAYSATIFACSAGTSPLLITGPVLGGALASPGTIEYWPGAAPNAKSSDLAAALHAQAARLGTKFMYDSVQSIDMSVQPYLIKTKLGGLLFASAVIVATGLSPKTLNLKDEVSLLGRSILTSAATVNGPHRGAAVVGNDCAAINEALVLSAKASKVTLVCGAPQLSCPPSLATKLSQTANIRVEYNATVSSYAIDESDGGPLLRGLTLKRSNEVFSIGATVVVLALGFEPKVDLLPAEAKTAEGFVKSDFSTSGLKGIFAAGTIVESTSNLQIMISASGFTAATSAIRYLSSVEASAASKEVVQPAAVPAEDKTKLAEASTIATASVPTSEAKADTTSKPTSASETPSAEASSETKVAAAPLIAPTSVTQSAPVSTTKRNLNLPKGRRSAAKTVCKRSEPPSSANTSAASSCRTNQLPPFDNLRPVAAIAKQSEDGRPEAPSLETR